ncbi:MAG: tyrosine-type recombinase/integrase [bacterium]
MARKLTKKMVDSLTYEGAVSERGTKGLHIVMDTTIPGFHVRLFPSGMKSYGLTYRWKGRKRFISIGRADKVTLDFARRQAQTLWEQIVAGEDPIENRRRQREFLTVAQFAEQFIERYAKKFRKTWREDARRIGKNILPALGNRRLDAVNRADVAALHSRIGETAPMESNRTMELIRRIYAVALDWGTLPDGFENPARKIKKFPERPRDRVLTEDELRRLGAALAQEQDVYAKGAITLSLLCGTRIGETLAAEWREINLEQRLWQIPSAHSKNKKAHTLPLSQAAVDLLVSLPRSLDDNRVFPTKNVRHAWERLRVAAGIPDVRIHDLRRSAASMMVDSGISLHVVSELLSHKNLAVTADVYAHLGTKPLAEAAEKHGAKVIDLLTVKKTG